MEWYMLPKNFGSKFHQLTIRFYIYLMKKIIISSIVFSFLLFAGCKSGNEPTAPTKSAVKVPEGPLAQKLYANYHTDPQTIDQKEENQLIEYAVNNNIDVTRSPSGLYYHVVKTSDGPNYVRGDEVTTDYRGVFLNGKEFDSSYGRGEPIKFKVGQMNPSWNEGLTYMNQGSSATFLVPSRLAYGAKGFPGYIEPNTPLVFTLECL